MNKNFSGKFAILKKIKKPLIVENLKIPNPSNHQVLVKIKYSFVCGSQLNEISGKKGYDKFLPHTLGHEASGEVLKVGKKVSNIKKGNKVILSWIKKSGKESPNPFYKNKKNKKINSGAVSTFSEFALISKNRVYKMPNKMPMDLAALFGCAVPTGFGIIFENVKKIQKNEIAVIYGVGGVGMMSVIALKSIGIKNIYAIDKNKKNLEIAKRFGCSKTFSLNSFIKNVNNLKINNNLIKYNIEISGNKQMMEMAIKHLSPKGLCILAGNIKFGDKVGLNPYELIFGKKILGFSGNSISLEKNIKKYFRVFKKIKLSDLRKIFKEYEFVKINKAITDFKNGKILRPLIKFH